MRVIMIGLRVCATTTSRSVCAIHIRQNETTRLTNTSGLVIDLMASSLVGWKESMSTAGVKSRFIAGGKTSPGPPPASEKALPEHPEEGILDWKILVRNHFERKGELP